MRLEKDTTITVTETEGRKLIRFGLAVPIAARKKQTSDVTKG